MNNHLRNVNKLDISIRCSGDVGELKKFFNGRKYGHNLFSRMLCCLIDDVLALETFVGHQTIIALLEESDHVCNGVVDGVCCAISDICRILFLDGGNDLLQKSLLEPPFFLKQTFFLGVRSLHVRICVGGCAVRYYEQI